MHKKMWNSKGLIRLQVDQDVTNEVSNGTLSLLRALVPKLEYLLPSGLFKEIFRGML